MRVIFFMNSILYLSQLVFCSHITLLETIVRMNEPTIMGTSEPTIMGTSEPTTSQPNSTTLPVQVTKRMVSEKESLTTILIVTGLCTIIIISVYLRNNYDGAIIICNTMINSCVTWSTNTTSRNTTSRNTTSGSTNTTANTTTLSTTAENTSEMKTSEHDFEEVTL